MAHEPTPKQRVSDMTPAEYAVAKKRLLANDSQRVDRHAREDAAAMARHHQLNTKKDPK